MKALALFVLLALAAMLVACGDATGNTVVDSEKAALEQQVAKLQASVAEGTAALQVKAAELSAIQGELTTLKEASTRLQADLAQAQKLVEQQKATLREENEKRVAAEEEADSCGTRIAELERKNNVLQQWVDICREQLDVTLE